MTITKKTLIILSIYRFHGYGDIHEMRSIKGCNIRDACRSAVNLCVNKNCKSYPKQCGGHFENVTLSTFGNKRLPFP